MYNQGVRNSVYKNKILEILAKKHLLSVADIQKEVEADFSTVFRNLEALVKDGLAKKVVISKDQVLYEKAGGEHQHDHFVCDDCGTIEEIKINRKGIKQKGVVRDILVRGVCVDCEK